MKSLLIALVLTTATVATATTLEFPITGDVYNSTRNRFEKVNIRALNAQLKKLGLEGLPELVIVGINAQAYGQLLQRRIAAIQQTTESKDAYIFNVDTGHLHDYPATICYRGFANDVPVILKSMIGTFLGNIQEILAIRYRSEMITYDRKFRSEAALLEAYDGGNVGTANWITYNKRSGTVLVMSNLGQDGDGLELYSTFIKACR